MVVLENINFYLLRLFFYSIPFSFFLSSGFLNAFFILLIFFCILYLKFEKKKLIIDKNDLFLLSFFFIIIISSVYNYNLIEKENVVKSILNLRFFLIYLIIKNLFILKICSFKKISLIFIISSLTLTLDIFIQNLIKFDIFGYPEFFERFSGFFGYESVAGSYLQKFFIISCFFFISLKNQKFLYLYTIITFLGIIFAQERMPLIIFIMTLILFSLLIDKKFFILCILVFLILFSYLKFQKNDTHRYIILINKSIQVAKNLIFKMESIYKMKDNSKVNTLRTHDFTFDQYDKIWSYSLKFITNNIIIGTGNKSFVYLSCTEKYGNNFNCARHPHNIYLEILVTSGILGFFLFIFFLFLTIKDLILKKKHIFFSFLLILIITEFLPFRPYGSIFSSFNGAIFWTMIGLVCSSKIYLKKNSK